MFEETLCREALAMSPAERAAFLDARCAGQPELRAAVEALLAAHEAAGGLLDVAPTVDSDPSAARPVAPRDHTPEPREPDTGPPSGDAVRPTSDYQPTFMPGTVIAGRYTLEQKLGEGGMGEVWVARQTEPVKRNVALKLIKAGMDSRAVLQRFEQERQALAMMDHPHIARVLDGGMTAARQPFFVMELVRGLPLTRFCDEAKLTPRERLELLVPICQAVQHAHQKGIVHRDLKPGNILVTLVDGKPIPKVIDFGVAKATGGKLIDETLSTQFGAVVGTLEYMSPEQAGFSRQDIDTRADIYSLGVILYELLTGLRPIDARRLKEAALTEMIRIIHEEEPSKPSTRLSTDESLPSLAALRQTEPRKLMALLRGELDWIVMKCLEKQRDRRYETASGLARDIQRYLADEPVEARPPSFGYRAGKFLRRNKGPVLAASVVLLALVAGIVGTTWGMVNAARRAEGERLARLDAQKSADAEREAKEETQRRLNQIEKGVQLLAGLLKGLNPRMEEKDGPPLYEQLREKARRAADQLDAESIGDPLAVAELQKILGDSLVELGDPAKAIEILEKALPTLERELGVDHINTLTTLNSLGVAYRAAGELANAIEMFERSSQTAVRTLGPDDPNAVGALGHLAMAYWSAGKLPQAMELYEQIGEGQGKFFDDADSEVLTMLNNMGLACRDAGKIPLAIELLERARDARLKLLGPDHTDTLGTLNNLALVYRDAGRLSEATQILEEVRDSVQNKLGADHPYTLTTQSSLARSYHLDGRISKGIALFEEIREPTLKRFGANHPNNLSMLNNLALAYLDDNKPLPAVELLEQVRDGAMKIMGREHFNTLATINSLGRAYHETGKLNEALELLEQVRDPIEKLGPDHLLTLSARRNLAAAYQDAGKLTEAIQLFEQIRDSAVRTFGADHANTLASLANLASAYADAGRLTEAFELFEQAANGIEAHGYSHPSAGRIIDQASSAYETAQQFEKAHPLRRRWLDAARTRFGPDSVQCADALAALGLHLLAQEQWDGAEAQLRQSLAIREKSQPDAWTTSNSKSQLGGALLGRKNYAGAEPLLLAGYEGMNKQKDQIPPQGMPRLAEALERLVQLYEATENRDEAARWRSEREAVKAAQKQPERQP